MIEWYLNIINFSTTCGLLWNHQLQRFCAHLWSWTGVRRLGRVVVVVVCLWQHLGVCPQWVEVLGWVEGNLGTNAGTLSGWWYTCPSDKYEFVSWDDDIHNIWKNKIHVRNHQPVLIPLFLRISLSTQGLQLGHVDLYPRSRVSSWACNSQGNGHLLPVCSQRTYCRHVCHQCIHKQLWITNC